VILSKEALQKPHRTVIDGTYKTNDQTLILSKAIKNSIIEELKTEETRIRSMVARDRPRLSFILASSGIGNFNINAIHIQ
jgi:hypothetical protein